MENNIYTITSMCAYELMSDFIGTLNPGHSTQDIKLRALAFEQILSTKYHNASGLIVAPFESDFRKFKDMAIQELFRPVNRILMDIDIIRDGFPLVGSLVTGYQKMLEVYSIWVRAN